MTATGPTFSINSIQKLSELELQKGIIGEGSWHDGIVDIHLIRDKKTGASKGVAFLGYENQRSTVLAIDNFNGCELLGRRIRVDHCKNFRAPKTHTKDEKNETIISETYEATGCEGKGIGAYGVTSDVKNILAAQQNIDSGTILTHEHSMLKDADEEWAQKFEESLRKEKKLRNKERKIKKKKKN